MIIIVFNASICSRHRHFLFTFILHCNPFVFFLMKFANKSHPNVVDSHPHLKLRSAVETCYSPSICNAIRLFVTQFANKSHPNVVDSHPDPQSSCPTLRSSLDTCFPPSFAVSSVRLYPNFTLTHTQLLSTQLHARARTHAHVRAHTHARAIYTLMLLATISRCLAAIGQHFPLALVL